jgi:hypothetical protein
MLISQSQIYESLSTNDVSWIRKAGKEPEQIGAECMDRSSETEVMIVGVDGATGGERCSIVSISLVHLPIVDPLPPPIPPAVPLPPTPWGLSGWANDGTVGGGRVLRHARCLFSTNKGIKLPLITIRQEPVVPPERCNISLILKVIIVLSWLTDYSIWPDPNVNAELSR